MPNSSPPAAKANSRKQVPKWQSWEKAAQDRKFLAIIAVVAIAAVAAFAAIAIRVRDAYTEYRSALDRRPMLINQSPPALLQPLVCDARKGLHTGAMRVFIKNIGTARATNIVPSLVLRVVPEQNANVPDNGQIPRGNCRDRPLAAAARAPLAAGETDSPLLPQPVLKFPPFPPQRHVSLYGLSCIYYTDDAGANHASCDTYHLRPAAGTPTFMCDGSAGSGTFVAALVASCAY